MSTPADAVRLLETRDQRVLLDGFTAALDVGAAVAVVDPTWPQPVVRAARRAVDEAHATGHLRPGLMVVFTSGSGDRPRGVLRTHDSWRRSLDPLTDLLGLGPDDVVWTPGPLWSSLSLYGAWHAATAGTATVVEGEDPVRVTIAHTVPSALPRLLMAAAGGRLPALRTVVLAGEPVTDRHRALCAQAGWAVAEYYGAAELSFVGWSDSGRPWQPFPGVEVQVRGGVLWARSEYLAEGYLDDGAAGATGSTGSAGPLRRDDHGWASVGDRAVELAGGFTVVGRGSATITTGGHTVEAEPVEALLAAVDGVVEVLVVGFPHPVLGEVVTALVVGDVSSVDLRASLQTLPSPARPRRWARPSALPRTSSGKPDRGRARALVADGSLPSGGLW